MHSKKSSQTLDYIIAFYVSIIVYLGVSFYVFDSYPNNLWVEIIMESMFALLVLIFSFFDYKEIVKLYSVPKLDHWIVLFILFSFINAFLVHYFVDFVNQLIATDTFTINYYEEYTYIENPFLWSFIFMAVLPPIFEELAFRGALFNALSKSTSIKATIITTSFLFALVHLSVLSIIWIFPFGILLGYLRWKYNSLWIPMIIHFIHNFTILLIDYYAYIPVE